MATTIAPDTSNIQGYLKDLQLAYEEAVRTSNQKNASLLAAQNEFNRKNNYFLKIKACWESIQTTNDLAVEACGNFNALDEIALDVKEKICLNLWIFQLLKVDVKDIVVRIEMYKACIEHLNSCIESLIKQDSGLEKKNRLIKALIALEAAWQEALNVAIKLLCDLLEVVECAFILKCRLAGGGLTIDPCPPIVTDPNNPTDPTTYGCDYPSPTGDPRNCRTDKKGDTIGEQKQDFCQVVAEAKDLWLCSPTNTENCFPLYTINDAGDYVFNCNYVATTKDKYDTSAAAKDSALTFLGESKMVADMASAKNKSIGKSLEAAKAAHKC